MAKPTLEELQAKLAELESQNAELAKQNADKTALIIDLENAVSNTVVKERQPDEKPPISEGPEAVAAWYFRMHPNYKLGSIFVSLKDGELFPATAKGENFCKNYCGDAYVAIGK